MEALVTILSTLGFQEYALVVLALSIFIDINPKIKFNPIKALLGFIGKYFNESVRQEMSAFKAEVNQKFEAMQKEQNAQRQTLNKLIIDQENKEISKLRWDIIDFETSIHNKEKHSRDQYRHILDSIKKFKRMASAQGSNVSPEDLAKICEAEEIILKHYEEHRTDQSLLFF